MFPFAPKGESAAARSSSSSFYVHGAWWAAVQVAFVLVGIIGVIVAVHWGQRVADRHADRVAAERRRVAGLVARANREHRWVLAGDPRGTYGEFPPATYGEFLLVTYGEFPPATK
jgi:hypothetical protein